MLANGALRGFTAKQRLAGDGLHYEPRWFKPWPSNVTTAIEIGGQKYPLGDLLFDVGGVRLGIEICEDAWVAERPAAGHSRLAGDIIFNPSASHFAFGKSTIRDRLVSEASRAFGVSYVYSNLIGNEAGRVIYDGQTLIATHGELVARGPRLGYQRVIVCERNQWKRERYAPSFHVDDKNLDPKTWCRFPILSGSFRRELAELKADR